MKYFNLVFIAGVIQLFANDASCAGAGRGGATSNEKNKDSAEIVGKAYRYLKSPEMLTADNVQRDFPGAYEKSGCEDRFKYCSHINTGDVDRTRLSSFDVAYRTDRMPIGGSLTISFPDSVECYRVSDLNALFGVKGIPSETPAGDMFFGAHDPETTMLQYRKISLKHPEFSANVFIHNQCVSTLHLDMRVRP